MHANVTIRQGEREVQTLRIDQDGQYLIGSDPSCQIRVDLPGVAPRHAQLTVRGGRVQIEDLGSASGTFLDSARLERVAAEVRGQSIQLGDMTPVIHTGDAPAPIPALRSTRYEVGGTVARGGMGEILKAQDRGIERTVALKVALDAATVREDLRRRFLQEAKLTGQLEHPNIVPVHELSFDENGRPFYTMKLVKGRSLQEVLDQLKAGDAAVLAAYSLAHLLTIFQKVCDAVAFAHSKGVVHRDLKPANIMIGEYGEVLVMDWGLAKLVRASEDRGSKMEDSERQSSIVHPPSAGLTMAGTVMGTPQFMAPEQAAGDLDAIDGRADIYALGGILYNILTLHPPVTGDSVGELLEKIRRGEIRPPTSYNAKSRVVKDRAVVPRPPLIPLRHCPGNRIPEALSAVAMKALAVKREERYQTVAELQREIAAYQGGFATVAEQAGLSRQLWLLVKRHKREFIISHAALLVLIAAAGLFLVKVTHEKRRAEQALADLKETAPTFHAEALALIKEHKFADALVRVEYAIKLVPGHAGYHSLRGDLLETLGRWPEARAAYAEALRCDPQQPWANENLQLCEKLIRDNADRREPLPASWLELQRAMTRQQRFSEAVALMARFRDDRQTLEDTLRAVLAKEGLSDRYNASVPTRLDLNKTRIEQLDFLAGLPLTELHCSGTRIKDLGPLRGMPLRRLRLANTPVSDLTPLKGMPLEELDLASTSVADLGVLRGLKLTKLFLKGSLVTSLEPLAGMPITELDVSALNLSDLTALHGMPLAVLAANDMQVTDLSPLRGAPLKRLSFKASPVDDLQPLRGMPLFELGCAQTRVADLAPLADSPVELLDLSATPVSDLRPLRGLPLKRLRIFNCKNLSDLSPLAECRQLEVLILPAGRRDIEFLRQHPSLRRLGDSSESDWNKVSTVAEFWKAYDAKHRLEK